MPNKTTCIIGGLTAIFCCFAPASSDSNASAEVSITGNVPGVANLWLAGMPEGSIAGDHWDVAPDQSPLEIKDVPLSGTIFTFTSTGGVAHGPDYGLVGSEGNTSVIWSRAPGPENGIGDIKAPVEALIGVFVDDNVPADSAVPAPLDFTTESERDFSTLKPALRQPFFIGDGRTSAGEIQQFVVPSGATRLFLGVMDSYGWSNNHGSFTVKIGYGSAVR